MSTGSKWTKVLRLFVLCMMVLASSGLCGAYATTTQHKKKAVKKPPPAPLPSGPTGQLPQIPLDSILPVPPQVTYQNGQLAIVAANSTLSDILKAVHKQTGAEIEIPAANDRVVTNLGPGPAQEVMAELLNGSRFNYVVLGSPQDPNALTKVVLVPKAGAEGANEQAGNQRPQVVDVPPQDMAEDNSNADAAQADDNAAAEETAEQPTEAEQPAANPEQPGVKTPQQMLQEIQQRQLQLQQQQLQLQTAQPGQPINQYPAQPQQPQEQQ